MGPLVAAGLALLAKTGIDVGIQSIGNRQTNKSNMKLAEYQYSKDLEMWNRNNQYNTPEAQMQRLSKAGLNPNLVYGNGTVTGNTSGQIPKYQAPTVDYRVNTSPVDIPATLAQFQNIELQKEQINNVKAQINATNQRTLNDAIKNTILATEAKRGNVNLGILEKMAPYMMSKQISEAEGAKVKVENLRFLQSLTKAQIEKIASEVNLNRSKMTTEQRRQDQILEDTLWKKSENELRKVGLTSKDSLLWRALFALFKKWNSEGPSDDPYDVINETR